MARSLNVLLFEDSACDAELIVRTLQRAGFTPECRRVESAADFTAALDATPDLILSDYRLPDCNGLEALRLVRNRGAQVPFIIVSGSRGEELAAECILNRAANYVLKDRLERLGPAVHQALESHDLRVGQLRMEAARQNERELAVAQLQQDEERHRLLFANNPLPMWLYDCETLGFLAVNDAAVQDYGYTRGEFLSMTVKEIHPPEDIPVLLTTIAANWGAPRRSSECRHRRKDGVIIRVEIASSPHAFDGRAARLVVAFDVTEKKLLEEKLLHAQRLESIGMLAAGIAHDLNNVLVPVMFAAPLLRDSVATERGQKILDTLEKSAARGAGLVKQILGFVRNTAGEFRQTQVKHLARDIVSLMEETFPKAIQVDHHIEPELWPVLGNATQIHQVLLNLCVNARDAMPQGGILRLTATNRLLQSSEARTILGSTVGGWIVLEVADTGTGIPPGMLDHIWTPFVTTKEESKGTGLGLPTVKGIVGNHHGFVELQSKVGHGSTFRVFLPAADQEPTLDGNTPLTAIQRGGGELVLLVDDDASIREIAATILENHGFRVITCSDGTEALAAFDTRAGEIAVVITDVDMPRLGGVALTRALLQLRPDLRLVAMSGLSRNNLGDLDIPEIRTLAHEFLQKPFKPEDLIGAVRRMIAPDLSITTRT